MNEQENVINKTFYLFYKNVDIYAKCISGINLHQV